MLRGIIRVVAILLILVVIGVVVVAATGGAFRVGGGVETVRPRVRRTADRLRN